MSECSHPVHNTYVPFQFEGSRFLREAGDAEGKEWDEEALRVWEKEENGGREWEGRGSTSVARAWVI